MLTNGTLLKNVSLKLVETSLSNSSLKKHVDNSVDYLVLGEYYEKLYVLLVYIMEFIMSSLTFDCKM